MTIPTALPTRHAGPGSTAPRRAGAPAPATLRQQALREGGEHVDLLQGWADYKIAWASRLRRSLTLRHYNRRPRGGLLKLLLGARDALKVVLR